MLEHTRALYADLAKTLGAAALPPDANGGIQLTIGEDTNVILFGENDVTLLVVAPVAALPRQPEYGVMLWLLRRNLYDSDMAPFQVACDEGGNLILWGRVPVEGMTGTALAGLLDAVAIESRRIRGEVEDAA